MSEKRCLSGDSSDAILLQVVAKDWQFPGSVVYTH